MECGFSLESVHGSEWDEGLSSTVGKALPPSLSFV